MDFLREKDFGGKLELAACDGDAQQG